MRPEWIAVDWGTSSLRAYAMRGREVLAEAQSAEGMGGLAPEAFEAALLRLIGEWIGDQPAEVLACGMVGARQGWVEAAYRATPCAPLGGPLTKAPSARLKVSIIAGLSQAEPADVMRGEETQIAGFLAQYQGFEGALCLPGTHSKWALIRAGEVVRFQTFMTGEIFALLSQSSVLRHSVGAGTEDAAFARGVREGLAGAGMEALFSLRAETLLCGASGDSGRGRLSGLLIGAELRAAEPFWRGRQVAVIGAPEISALSARALAYAGVDATLMAGSAAVLAGLIAAREGGL